MPIGDSEAYGDIESARVAAVFYARAHPDPVRVTIFQDGVQFRTITIRASDFTQIC
jgi:hypothetical protein